MALHLQVSSAEPDDVQDGQAAQGPVHPVGEGQLADGRVVHILALGVIGVSLVEAHGSPTAASRTSQTVSSACSGRESRTFAADGEKRTTYGGEVTGAFPAAPPCRWRGCRRSRRRRTRRPPGHGRTSCYGEHALLIGEQVELQRAEAGLAQRPLHQLHHRAGRAVQHDALDAVRGAVAVQHRERAMRETLVNRRASRAQLGPGQAGRSSGLRDRTCGAGRWAEVSAEVRLLG